MVLSEIQKRVEKCMASLLLLKGLFVGGGGGGESREPGIGPSNILGT